MSAATDQNKRARRSHVWERDDLDWYVEPPEATEALLSVERFIGPVWDPACGGGNIIETYVNVNGGCAVGTDIVRRTDSPGFAMELDFLSDFDHAAMEPVFHSNIVMNPPFFRAKGAEAFIRKAISLVSGKVCAFVDIRFIAGGERANGLFKDHPPHRIWVVTPRVSCPPGSFLAAGGKAGNGSSDWCWLVFDNASPFTGTSFGWLRRTKRK
jgi:hypothetical protein